MRTNDSCRWTLVLPAISLLAVSVSEGSTMPTRSLELTSEQKEVLWATACYMYPQEIRTRQQYGGPDEIDHAEVYCGAHAEYAGMPIGLYVSCSRPSGAAHWKCRKAVPTMEMKIGQRTVRILYTFASAREALMVIEYMLSRPLLGNVAVDPDWIESDVYIHGSDGRFLVTASNRNVKLIREDEQHGEPRFTIESISICQVDVCHPIAGR